MKVKELVAVVGDELKQERIARRKAQLREKMLEIRATEKVLETLTAEYDELCDEDV